MIFKREPVFFQALLQAAIAFAAAFGFVNWSVEQISAVLGVSAAVFAIIARSQVTPNHRVPDVAAGPGRLAPVPQQNTGTTGGAE